MQDIADRVGVTRATVSLALRNDPRISEKTADKVRSIAEELGYDPMAHQAARRMGLRRHGRELLTRQIALLAPRCALEANYYRQITDAIWLALVTRGYSLLLVDADGVSALDRGDGFSSLLKPDEIDGLLCLAHPDTLARATDLRKRAGLKVLPAVSLIAELPGFSSVISDEHGAGRKLARTLIDLGHRQFLCAESIPSPLRRLRWQGFVQGLRDAGLDPDKAFAAQLCNGRWMDPARSKQRLRATTSDADDTAFVAGWQNSDATAIVCGNDPVALHVRGALLRAGITTPHDVTLVGYDDSDADADPFHLLSTVDVKLGAMGEEGVKLLLEMISEDSPQPRAVVLEAQVHLRATAGPPPKR